MQTVAVRLREFLFRWILPTIKALVLVFLLAEVAAGVLLSLYVAHRTHFFMWGVFTFAVFCVVTFIVDVTVMIITAPQSARDEIQRHIDQEKRERSQEVP